MRRCHLLPAAFAVLLVLGAWHRPASPDAVPPEALAEIEELREALPPQDPGGFPAEWIAGKDCVNDPHIQVHAYNRDLYILRQSKCKTFEAPFLYLIFGEERVLLMDTGATPNVDVWGTVDGIIQKWLIARGKTATRLVVAHTHGHGDHVAGTSQFIGKPYVEKVVNTSLGAVTDYFGFQDWPNDVGSIDLGDRVIDVLATPGHHPVSISLYDRRTQLLLSGDIVYPGHLFVFQPSDWQVFVDSLLRMVTWAQTHPVTWVVGCHIEMAADGSPYKWGRKKHPNEHVLQFPPSKMVEILRDARNMAADPQCEVRNMFVMHPVYKCGIFWNG